MRHRLLFRIISACAAPLLVAGCGSGDEAPVKVSVIGTGSEIAAPLKFADTRAGQAMLGASARGLVSVDDDGTVIPALAQRWIVINEGQGYIFRLRRASWADGGKVDAREVRQLLQARLRSRQKQDPYGPLAAVDQVIAMTDDVLEVRLKSVRPNFLAALADSVMAIARSSGGSGPYRKQRASAEEDDVWLLQPLDSLGNVEDEAPARERRLLRAERASRGIIRFREGEIDLLLGGTVAELPYLSIANIRESFVRFDPVQGLFGLAVSGRSARLADADLRRALAMGVDRTAVVSAYSVARWKIAEQIIPHQLNLPHPPTVPDWAALPMERRRELAKDGIARWQQRNDNAPLIVSINLPKGPGMAMLFVALQRQYRQIGVALRRVERGADLQFIDEVAPYDSVAWYLGRLSCARGVACDEDAEELLKASLVAQSMEQRLVLLGQAEQLVVAHGGFIPLAMPVRWSLVNGRLDGFTPSPRAVHPLDRLTK